MSMSKYASSFDYWKSRATVLENALRTTREFIRGEQIEHAVVDLAQPDYSLGQFIDDALYVKDPR